MSDAPLGAYVQEILGLRKVVAIILSDVEAFFEEARATTDPAELVELVNNGVDLENWLEFGYTAIGITQVDRDFSKVIADATFDGDTQVDDLGV